MARIRVTRIRLVSEIHAAITTRARRKLPRTFPVDRGFYVRKLRDGGTRSKYNERK